MAVRQKSVHVSFPGLYQGMASAVPKSIIFPRALAPEPAGAGAKAHMFLRPFGTTKVVP
jgi:hypothetical protein